MKIYETWVFLEKPHKVTGKVGWIKTGENPDREVLEKIINNVQKLNPYVEYQIRERAVGEQKENKMTENFLQEPITLRDYFAAQAMNGLLTGSEHVELPHHLSKAAYIIADEMIKARKTSSQG